MKKEFLKSANNLPVDQNDWNWSNTFGLLFIIFLSFWTFQSVGKLGFVWDDFEYIQTNKMLAQDLSISIPHFFGQNYYVGNYHPVTMSSYALIYQKAKLNPELYHQVVLLFHVLNSLLVFWMIWILNQGRFVVAAVVSALFAVHPMHVESVAWASELKDVLYTFFFILGLICYLKTYQKQSRLLYLMFCFLFFVISMLCKPAAVCFPLVLMVFDYYKINQFQWKTALEKIPFFMAALWMGVVTIMAQDKAVGSIGQYEFFERVMISSFASIFYLVKLIIPINLSALHPFPVSSGGDFPLYYKLAPFMILVLFFALWYLRRSNKTLVFGFLFFFASIVLVLQFLTVGMAVVSERYTYVPYIGLFYIIAYYVDTYFKQRYSNSVSANFTLGMLIMPILVFSWMSKNRVMVWQNNKTLWTDVVAKYPESAVANYNLGSFYFKELKDDDSSLVYFQKTIQRDPLHYRALINLGLINGRRKNKDLAMDYFKRAEQINPDYFELYKNRGFVLSMFGETDRALGDFTKYLSLVPKDAQILYGRGLIYQMKKENEKAHADFEAAVLYEPRNAGFWLTKAESALELGRIETARKDLEMAIQLGAKPKPDLRRRLGL
ncbi:MAG: tetratricopeptide repeat protein [Saprospiraceae bacterium]|nr:tetratricopeptide repeat protein [Saprospiraceae bacterium]